MFNPKNILVPIDFSETAEKAFQNAVDIAKRNNSDIFLLHVIEVIQQCAVDYCLDNAVVEQIENKSTAVSQEMLQKMIDKFPETKGLRIHKDVTKGTPYEVILKEQEAKKIDLIVIASHGKKGLLWHLLGSVTEKVVSTAKCQVLIIRG
jgi:nucleotide-binding universal stress UspA family protein